MHSLVKPIGFLVVAVVAVAVLWFLFKPQRSELPTSDRPTAAGPNAPAAMSVPAEGPGQTAQGTSARSEVFELAIKGGRLVSGPAVFQVHQGEQVTLHIRSDSGDELHLHGYDLQASIRPGETASLQFTANRTGRFGFELHKARTELGALEVYPQ